MNTAKWKQAAPPSEVAVDSWTFVSTDIIYTESGIAEGHARVDVYYDPHQGRLYRRISVPSRTRWVMLDLLEST